MTLALASTLASTRGSGESLTNRAYKLVILIALILTLAVGIYLLINLTGVWDAIFGGTVSWIKNGVKSIFLNYTPIGWVITGWTALGSSWLSWNKKRII